MNLLTPTVILTLLLLLSTADAATRVPVWKPDRTNAQIICPYVTMGVPPGTPEGHYTLGVCPARPPIVMPR